MSEMTPADPAPIYEVNGAMRGMVVPKGAHTVTMRYRPVSVYLGGALTLLGILIALTVSRPWSSAVPGSRPASA